MKRIDHTGQRFGRLVVLNYAGTAQKCARWRCRCDCGNETTVNAPFLRQGRIRSCGCLLRETIVHHGMYRSREYRTWDGMKQRCGNRNHAAYPYYGGRGIVVCQRWRESFEAFYADMGPAPVDRTLDRIDNNGPYSPENCRWATKVEQSANRRPYPANRKPRGH